MRLRVFKADKGDALLLTSKNGKKNMMIDGGMGGAYREHCAKVISKLKKLDVVYVSHIDRDHVEGVYQMLDDAVAWRVHEFLKEHGNPNHKRPKDPKPPPITKFWQNNFHEQVDDNGGEIEDMLASQAYTLSAHANPGIREIAAEQQELAQSVGDALRISWRIAEDQLDIPVNPEFDTKLIRVADPADVFRVGSMRWTPIGPSKLDLDALREEWNDWLDEMKAHKARLKKKSTSGFSPLVSASLDAFVAPLLAQADDLVESNPRFRAALEEKSAAEIGLARKLGNRKKVSTPNLASLMFFVREGKRTLLLTGDGHCDDVVAGLDNAGLLRSDGTLHVNVLKVPHHGSEHNTSPDFCKAITADKYVFCGNGAHDNPDLDVVKAYIDSRIGPASRRSKNREVGRRFRLVFNYHPSNETGKRGAHLSKILKQVKAREKKSSRLSSTFIKGSSAAVPV